MWEAYIVLWQFCYTRGLVPRSLQTTVGSGLFPYIGARLAHENLSDIDSKFRGLLD